MRLLYCAHCKSLEEIPEYEGIEDVDPLIEEVVRQHNVREPMAHGGAHLKASPMRLAQVDDLEWALDKDKIIKQINESNKQVGFDSWVYDSHSTFHEDAMKCFKQHNRPDFATNRCIDYRSESKRIGRPTVEGQEALRTNFKLKKKDPHLCDWCPYSSTVQTEKNYKLGLYKE